MVASGGLRYLSCILGVEASAYNVVLRMSCTLVFLPTLLCCSMGWGSFI
jgi:hypothetical protein